MDGGRSEKSWGFRKSSVDNPVYSKIPLDLGFPVRESTRRTGKRTPTGARKTGCHRAVFGPGGGTQVPGPRGESGLGMGREATELRSAGPTGDRRCGAEKCPIRRRRGTPTIPPEEDRAASSEDAGKPGQRERRRGADGAGQPADRGTDSGSGGRASGGSGRRALRQRRPTFGPADGVGAGPASGNRCGAVEATGRATGDRASTPGAEAGSPAVVVGAADSRRVRPVVPPGFGPGVVCRRQQGRVRPADWPKKGIARRIPSGNRRAM